MDFEDVPVSRIYQSLLALNLSSFHVPDLRIAGLIPSKLKLIIKIRTYGFHRSW